MKITEYFTDKELQCKCGCGMLPSKRSVERLYAARLIYNKPILITSGARCAKRNAEVDGKKSSRHLTGNAFDIVRPFPGSTDDAMLFSILKYVGFLGFGFGRTIIHIDDDREIYTEWKYTDK